MQVIPPPPVGVVLVPAPLVSLVRLPLVEGGEEEEGEEITYISTSVFSTTAASAVVGGVI